MRSGNMLVDMMEDTMNRKTVTCSRCAGSGKVDWDDFEFFCDELSYLIYKMKRFGKEPKTWRESLKFARQIYKAGQTCDLCDGSGEVEA